MSSSAGSTDDAEDESYDAPPPMVHSMKQRHSSSGALT